MSKENRCRYRNCKKPIDFDLHGNRFYCIPEENSQYKFSCKAKEESLKIKEREDSRLREQEDKTKLRVKIEDALNGREEKNLTPDKFDEMIFPFMRYFSEDYIKRKGLETKIYRFEGCAMFKWKVGGKYFAHLTRKKLNYEK